ncbi:MAG: alginate lyase family protein [Pseudomonadota bacterium]
MMRWLVVCAALCPAPLMAACPDVPTPVIDLRFDSRYADDDPTRSTIDVEAEDDAKSALAPVDDFISDLTRRTDSALADQDRDAATCVLAALAEWAEADALSQLGSDTAELTIGSRLAALAIVAAQVLPAGDATHSTTVRDWLSRRMTDQMTFWETAPDGAASGNLRAWAALAGAGTALITGDPVIRGWSAWSLTYVLCTAAPDGSLPQEMSRAHLALHYQLHAVGPLVVTAALLNRQGVPLSNRCDQALDRIVAFTLRDVDAGGTESAAHAGEAQSVSEGLAAVPDFQLAWAEAWLSLRDDPELNTALTDRRPLKYTKLGGDQTRLWSE